MLRSATFIGLQAAQHNSPRLVEYASMGCHRCYTKRTAEHTNEKSPAKKGLEPLIAGMRVSAM